MTTFPQSQPARPSSALHRAARLAAPLALLGTALALATAAAVAAPLAVLTGLVIVFGALLVAVRARTAAGSDPCFWLSLTTAAVFIASCWSVVAEDQWAAFGGFRLGPLLAVAIGFSVAAGTRAAQDF